jgi:hypothetical protein
VLKVAPRLDVLTIGGRPCGIKPSQEFLREGALGFIISMRGGCVLFYKHNMPINLDKPQRWKEDVIRSVDMYNDWFMKFAPQAFRNTRIQTTKDVEDALHATGGERCQVPFLSRNDAAEC